MNNKHINNNIIKQLFLILLICVLAGLIIYHLSMFIPSVLGAVALYIIFRNFNNYLIFKKGWKPWLSSITIILLTIVMLILPMYYLIDSLVGKIGNTANYLNQLNQVVDKVHGFILDNTGFDFLSKDNLSQIKGTIGSISSKILSTTLNSGTILFSAYFILYFMFTNPIKFERIVANAIPFNKANKDKLSTKFRKLVIANAVGIPVVAFAQGLIALVGYLIFGASNPFLLFALTAITSIIPIVGSTIVYIPVCILMITEGNTTMGIGLLIYCVVAVGLTDNILRFTLLKRLEDIHPLNTVFGIILGLNLFGFMGLVYGPIIVSITLLLIQVYSDEFNKENKAKDKLNINLSEVTFDDAEKSSTS